jgi:hypothetical protein
MDTQPLAQMEIYSSHDAALNFPSPASDGDRVMRVQDARQERRRRKMQSWAASESSRLVELMAKHGRNWSLISLQLGRTTASVRNRVGRMHKTRSSKGQLCKRCGEPRAGHVCKAQLRDAASPETVLFVDFSEFLGEDVARIPISRSSSMNTVEAEAFVSSVFAEDDGDVVITKQLSQEEVLDCKFAEAREDGRVIDLCHDALD